MGVTVTKKSQFKITGRQGIDEIRIDLMAGMFGGIGIDIDIDGETCVADLSIEVAEAWAEAMLVMVKEARS